MEKINASDPYNELYNVYTWTWTKLYNENH